MSPTSIGGQVMDSLASKRVVLSQRNRIPGGGHSGKDSPRVLVPGAPRNGKIADQSPGSFCWASSNNFVRHWAYDCPSIGYPAERIMAARSGIRTAEGLTRWKVCPSDS